MTLIENYIDIAEAVKIILFVASGLFGMSFAYCRKWAHTDTGAGLFMYMFGDERATMRAITTFVAMCVGAGGLSYLDTLTINQIIIFSQKFSTLIFTFRRLSYQRKSCQSTELSGKHFS